MKIRIPLIPGFSDSEEDIRKIAHFVKEELGKIEIELLSYNKLGEAKYERMGKTGPHFDIQSEEYVLKLKDIVNSELSTVDLN
jgi:pyruvate formate lyase activating enzyme